MEDVQLKDIVISFDCPVLDRIVEIKLDNPQYFKNISSLGYYNSVHLSVQCECGEKHSMKIYQGDKNGLCS